MQRFNFLTALALSVGLAAGCADTGNNAGTAGDAETGAVENPPADTTTVEEGGVNQPPNDPAVEEQPADELPDDGAAAE